MNTPKRMNTSVERVFRPLPNGLYREIILKFINFINEDNTIQRSKLDSQVEGGLYTVAKKDTDMSPYGEVLYTFPGHEKPTRLLALGRELSDYRYGRY